MLVAEDNPFVTSPGRVPARFGGRGVVLADARGLLARLQAGRNAGEQILEGLRGMGKTALMAHVRALAADRDIVTVGLELGPDNDAVVYRGLQRVRRSLEAGGSMRQVAERIRGVKAGPVAAELADPAADHALDVAQMVADVAAVAASAGRSVLVTVDEAHEHPHLACEVIRGLHAAGQDNRPIGAYLAGLPGTHQRLAEVTTYAERILVTQLELLDYDGVAQALAGPCRDLGVLVDDRVVDVVVDESSGYPYFVQVWGHHLWRAAAANDNDQIDLADLDRARPDARADIARLYASRWQRLTGRQRDYLDALAVAGGTGKSSAVADAIGLDVTSASHIRAQLLERGMIYAPAYGQVAVTIPGFANWITTNT